MVRRRKYERYGDNAKREGFIGFVVTVVVGGGGGL